MSDLSVATILGNLEARVTFHRDRVAHHAELEGLHREQGAFHAAELEKATASLEAFRATAAVAAGLLQQPVDARRVEAAEPDPGTGSTGRTASKLIARYVASLPAGETFSPTGIAAEVERRYRQRLKKPLEVRTVSVVLRKLRDAGEIREVRAGRPFHEALYAR